MQWFARGKSLRKGRKSIPGAAYFVTWCLKKPHSLDQPEWFHLAWKEAIEASIRDHCLTQVWSVVMPDHGHLVFTLGSRLELSQLMGRMKSHTQRVSASGFPFQEGYFDHRIRNAAFHEKFVQYIFLNPYRKNLLKPNHVWPGWQTWRDHPYPFEKEWMQTRKLPLHVMMPWPMDKSDPDSM